MSIPEQETSAPVVFIDEDDLLRLELKVAKRADELSEESGRIRGKDLEHWLRAEQEVFERCRREVDPGLTGAWCWPAQAGPAGFAELGVMKRKTK